MRAKRRCMHGKRLRKSPLLKGDTLETTLSDSVYRKPKVDKSLIKKGYDPNTRRTIKGKHGIHSRTVVDVIDKKMDDVSIVGSQVPQAPDDYLR